MKRVTFFVLFMGILSVMAPQPARAQGQRIGAIINIGFMTKERVSPNWVTLGAEVELPLGTRLSFNPEVTLWETGFRFTGYYIVPGALVNFRIGRLNFGVGAVRRFFVSRYTNNHPSEKIAPKFQVAYRSRNARIALVVIPLSVPHDYVSFGVALGMVF